MRLGLMLLALLTIGAWNPPPRAQIAPRGWYVNGVRPDGRYEMLPALGRPERDLDDAHGRVEISDERKVVGWIWCWLPETPRQDGQKVWCSP